MIIRRPRLLSSHGARRLPLSATARRRNWSVWAGTQPLAPDPILGMTAAFVEDPHPSKVNVGQGLYRDDDGQPYVLSSVKEAEDRVAAALRDGRGNKEYLPIEGHAAFRRLSAELVLGKSSAGLAEDRVATLQTISGTGALAVAASALRQVGGIAEIYVPLPTWRNHPQIFAAAGLAGHEVEPAPSGEGRRRRSGRAAVGLGRRIRRSAAGARVGRAPGVGARRGDADA